MSREERKMAQIIASIERMEQETRASGDGVDAVGRSQEPHDAARQGNRGKKGKKNKSSGVKVKPGRRLKVMAVEMGAGGGREPFERRLTPKKRWIQLWSAQQDTSKERDTSSSSEELEKELADRVETDKPAVSEVDTSPVSAVKVTPAAPPAVVDDKQEEAPKISEKLVPSPKAVVAAEKPVPVPIPVVVKSKPREQTEKPAAETPTSTMTSASTTATPKLVAATTSLTSVKAATPKTSSTASDLRVKTPLNNESSHLSPPLERNSPTTTASISPSAKVKDSDAPNTNTAATAAKFSPTVTEQERPVVTVKKEIPRREPVVPKLERKSSSSSSVGKSYRRETSDRHQDRGRKRSLERNDLPMSEEAKRRAERRRKRKTNWDVGDPRKGGSPVTDPPISAAAAAANQQSFAKYPPNRPPWRHSQSMMDMKPHFHSPSGHPRSSSFYNSSSSTSSSGARRGFYHATSLPQDRSRSAGRSSMRYSYGGGSSSSNTSANPTSNYR